ncbi:MAG: hypothetical protein JXR54_01175 [Tannerellaceae bacterium]|nr:hypothetical protein [Tannerellaceae bacterium]
MDNLGDWLYIVFLIIAAVSGLLGSGKKKKRPSEVLGQPDRDIVPEQEKAPEKSFWEMLEEMQEGKPKPAQVSKPATRPAMKVKEKQRLAPSPFLNNESKFTKTIPTAQVTMQEEEEHSAIPNLSFSDPDEIKKAIIYSEIFNRKY